jgi:hypothetical protein
MDEACVYRSRTIIPLNEVECTCDVEARSPNRRLIQLTVNVCAANIYSAKHCVFRRTNGTSELVLKTAVGECSS